VSPKKILSTEEFIARGTPKKNMQLRASASFNEEEINALDTVLLTLLRGGDCSAMKKSKALIEIAQKKLPVMKTALERQRERRAAAKAAE